MVLATFNQKNYGRGSPKFLVSGKGNNAHNYQKLRVTRKIERKKESVYESKELKACSTKDKKNLKPVNAFLCMAEKLGRFLNVFASFPVSILIKANFLMNFPNQTSMR